MLGLIGVFWVATVDFGRVRAWEDPCRVEWPSFRSGMWCLAAQGMEDMGVNVFPGVRRAKLQHDSAYADAYDGSDL
jgi:hypothetical protein